MPSMLKVKLPMETGYLSPLNWTCSMPSKPQRMKEAWENQDATEERHRSEVTDVAENTLHTR